jgi:hypothetical protein
MKLNFTNFQVEVFRVVTPCSVVVRYKRFKRPMLKSASCHNTTRLHDPQGLDLKHRHRESIKIHFTDFL